MDVVDVDVEKPETLKERPQYEGPTHALLPTATLTRKGQITIPKVVREALNAHAGDRIDFVVESEGRVVVRVRTTTTDR
jgi:AbrB family looped-hinge helix DNA binding protein